MSGDNFFTGPVGPVNLAIPENLLARQWFLPVRDRRTGASLEPCTITCMLVSISFITEPFFIFRLKIPFEQQTLITRITNQCFKLLYLLNNEPFFIFRLTSLRNNKHPESWAPCLLLIPLSYWWFPNLTPDLCLGWTQRNFLPNPYQNTE